MKIFNFIKWQLGRLDKSDILLFCLVSFTISMMLSLVIFGPKGAIIVFLIWMFALGVYLLVELCKCVRRQYLFYLETIEDEKDDIVSALKGK